MSFVYGRTYVEERLHGSRRYDPMKGEGRIVSGATIENDSGDKVEA